MGTYQKRIWQALAVQMAGAVAAMAAIFTLVAWAPQLPLFVVIAGLTLAGAVVLAAGQPWWRRIDEMEREAHALSWYEGSILGAVAALMWMLGLAAHSGAHRELALGGGLCFIAQGLAYLVFWAIRSWGRRSRTVAR
jgi:hypothetical protein